MEEEVLKRIQNIRKNKGFTYENLTNDLNISTAAYRKIELNKTKLTLERLSQIAEALETKVEDLLGLKPNKIYKQEITENSIGYQDIQNLYTENKETTEKLIAQFEARLQEKDELIQLLKSNK
ncbi:MAG: helix-turn-helix transcriptional regulator [Flavobacteriia bacterium]|nr:helix-turn-helix transcriptional regulator [Flavobacteriia bacterium]